MDSRKVIYILTYYTVFACFTVIILIRRFSGTAEGRGLKGILLLGKFRPIDLLDTDISLVFLEIPKRIYKIVYLVAYDRLQCQTKRTPRFCRRILALYAKAHIADQTDFHLLHFACSSDEVICFL